MNENPLQGSFIVDELTDLVEQAVLTEFDRITERGGVLGAMETGYQRGRIQDESMLYEHRKHDGSLPIIGVNTFRAPDSDAEPVKLELARGTEAEKQSQLNRLAEFHDAHRVEAGRGPAAAAGCRARTCRQPSEPVRGADGRGSGLLAGAGHRGLLRDRRPVPAQRLSAAASHPGTSRRTGPTLSHGG